MNKSDTAPKAFISHSSKDKQRFVRGFVENLKKKGINPWYDEEDISIGDSIVDKIYNEGIPESDFFIIVISQNSASSNWVNDELNKAAIKKLQEKHKIIPVVIEDCDIPNILSDLKYIRIDSFDNYEKQLNEIVNSIFNVSDKTKVGPKPSFSNLEIPTTYELQKIDNIVFNEICQIHLKEDEEIILTYKFIPRMKELDIPDDTFEDSLEILEYKGLLEFHGNSITSKCPIAISVPIYAFEEWLNTNFENYKQIYHKVLAFIANDNVKNSTDICKEFNLPLTISNHILSKLEDDEMVVLASTIQNHKILINTTVKLKRLVQKGYRKMINTKSFEYDIAVSFAGEDRELVKEFVNGLAKNNVKVFYDKHEDSTLWGKNLYDFLSDIYSKKAKYCVMFISENYAKKVWTNHERQAAQARAFQEHEEYILPIQLDNTKIPGLLDTIGYVDTQNYSIDQLINMTLKKLNKSPVNQTKNHHATSSHSTAFQNIPMPPIKKEWTDKEKDTFLKKSFFFIKDYFSEAFQQLEKLYPNAESSIDLIEKYKFKAIIYINGKQKAICKIWLGSFHGESKNQIYYCENSSVSFNDSSFNEYLTVDDTAKELQIKLCNLSMMNKNPIDDVVSMEKAAEFLWKRFIQWIN